MQAACMRVLDLWGGKKGKGDCVSQSPCRRKMAGAKDSSRRGRSVLHEELRLGNFLILDEADGAHRIPIRPDVWRVIRLGEPKTGRIHQSLGTSCMEDESCGSSFVPSSKAFKGISACKAWGGLLYLLFPRIRLR